MRKHLLLLLSLGLAGNATAGCGEGSGTCYYYKAGELKGQDKCAVTTCAATDQYFFSTWDWDNGNQVAITLTEDKQGTLVNGKPGYVLQLPFKDERMLCYAVAADDELLCNDSGAY
ncbi:hypothetical protein LRS11_12870 [Pseudomonas sp. J452]|uniref:hypothetical protein n=1 Tax=Pseudomonas sp. J452 TaxID=2898441 RepID=UPI0021AE0332|nr:hypothetical protein [Pseudomonas sp. J452]UUY06752.1 hypothetical protein LRS11_12870 [Pseudomonas sp. J452]